MSRDAHLGAQNCKFKESNYYNSQDPSGRREVVETGMGHRGGYSRMAGKVQFLDLNGGCKGVYFIVIH